MSFSFGECSPVEIKINGVAATVTASSELASKTPGAYSVKNLFDNDEKTAWVEGVKGDGAGEYISIAFKENKNIIGIYFIPGYTKSISTFATNLQPSIISLEADDKNCGFYHIPYRYEYFDTAGKDGCLPNSDPINMSTRMVIFKAPVNVKRLRMRIESAVEGTTKYSDLAISELGIFFKDSNNYNCKIPLHVLRTMQQGLAESILLDNAKIEDLNSKLIVQSNTLISRYKNVKIFQPKLNGAGQDNVDIEEKKVWTEIKNPESVNRNIFTKKINDQMIYTKFLNHCINSFIGSVVTIDTVSNQIRLVGMKSFSAYCEFGEGENVTLEYYPEITINKEQKISSMEEKVENIYSEPFCFLSIPRS